MTNDDTANLAAVTSARLLARSVPVIARAHSDETATLMQSFGKPQIVDPFVAFAEQLMMAMRAPGCYRLFDWLTAPADTDLARELDPPRGNWIVCGYGRFGRAVVERLRERGVSVRVLDPAPQAVGDAEVVAGDGTKREALERAGLLDAQALVAGTDDDLRNLAIASLAQTMNPKLFIVLRQNRASNAVLFEHFRADLVMKPSEIVADECVALLTSPLLLRFLRTVRHETDAWADEVIHQLRKRSGKRTPTTWELRLDSEQAPAACEHIAASNRSLRLGDLLRDPDDRLKRIEATALMVLRAGQQTILPNDDWALAEGDEVLFAGRGRARRAMTVTLCNPNVLGYVLTGREPAYRWRRQRAGA